METEEFGAELRADVLRYVVGGLLAVATAAAVWNAATFWTITVDDSYISLRYARNLIEGRGWVYNPGERVEGFSNPPWTLLMALTLLLGSDSLEGTKILALIAHGAGVIAAAGLARELARPRGAAAQVAIPLGAAFLAVSLPAAFWPSTGLETTFYATLLAGSAWRLLVELRDPGRRPLSAALAGLTAITRPEAPLLVAGLAAGRLWAGRREPRSLLPWLGVFAVPTIGYLLFRLAYYGKPLANTAYQKGHSAPLWSLWDYLRPWLSLEGPFLAVGAAGLIALAARRWRPFWPVLLLVGGHLFFLFWVCRDWMPNQRFVVPALPFLAVGAGAGAALLADALRGRAQWAAPAALALVLAAQARASLPLWEVEYSKKNDVVTRIPREEWMALPAAFDHTWKGHSDGSSPLSMKIFPEIAACVPPSDPSAPAPALVPLLASVFWGLSASSGRSGREPGPRSGA